MENSCKTCTKCKEPKPLTAFGKSKQTDDGLLRQCKKCTSERARLNYFRQKQEKQSRILPAEKRCSVCESTKPSSEFYRRAGNKDGLNRWCKACSYAFKQTSRNRDKERTWEYARKFGITPHDYDRIAEMQGYKCAVCKRRDSGSKHKTRLSVDHNHITGQVRGLLCDGCNRGIGLLGDDVERLQAAVEYLKAYKRLGNHAA